MHWIIAGLIVFFSSVLLYLAVRKSQIDGIPTPLTNLAMFAVPCAVYFLVLLYQRQSFVLPVQTIILLFLAALFFSYFGNVWSLRSIKQSPNPGYSLVISKSYVTFTVLAAVPLFGSELTPKNICAIGMILIFSALIMISGKQEKRVSSRTWLWYAVGAYFAWAFLALFSTYVLGLGIPVMVYLFYLTLFVSLFIVLEIRMTHLQSNTSPGWIRVLSAIGIFSMIFNLFIQIGYSLAPNPGYINAVNASSISLVTLASAYLYKDLLTRRKIVGVFGVIAGLVVLFV